MGQQMHTHCTLLRPQKNSCTIGSQPAGPQVFIEPLLCAGEASALNKQKYKKLNV